MDSITSKRTIILIFIIGVFSIPLISETISGTISDSSGQVLTDAIVSIEFFPGSRIRSTRTDQQGR